MARYFLGVDIGNTKSHCVICDEQGQAVGVGVAGPGNHEGLGKDGFAKILSQVIDEAIAMSGIELSDISAAGYGIAGYDWSEDLPLMQEVFAGLGFAVPYGLMNDSEPGLLAGSSNGWGVSVSAGTSANARGRDANGRSARMTGNGMPFGEWGGGGELVRQAIQSISRAWSLRGPQTLLSDLFLERVGATDVEDFLAGIARDRYLCVATDAPLVFQAAEAGDEVALDILAWLGEGLGDQACGIIRQLEIEDLAFDVVLSGSIYKGNPLIQETMERVIYDLAPKARFVHVSAPPVTGAVMLAMEQLGVDYLSIREQIITTGTQLLSSKQ
jgi:N-acetylglucosamine kinase-like BadF-type ATPase